MKPGEKVTVKNQFLGARVVRNPLHWDWGRQDSDSVGIVKALASKGYKWIGISWNEGKSDIDYYRVGSDRKYDLLFALPSPDEVMSQIEDNLSKLENKLKST